MDGVRGYSREQSDDLWRPPSETEPPGAPQAAPDDASDPIEEPDASSGGYRLARLPQQTPSEPSSPPQPPRRRRTEREPREPHGPRILRLPRATRGEQPEPADPPASAPRQRMPLDGAPLEPFETDHYYADADPDDPTDLDSRGGVWRPTTVRTGPIEQPRRRRRRLVLRITTGLLALVVLTVAGLGTYAYNHLFGQVATENLDALSNRPAASRADRWGKVPENILLLGSQTRDGQHGRHLGNSSKLGTDISDTVMLVHINAERKWATVVSIPRDLVVPRPRCPGRLDPSRTVPAARSAMFDLAMNLGGPTCAVATVEQMTGIRIDHFVEITFNAFQDLTDAVGGVTVCVPPPGINDPDYSGLVLGPGLHTVSGAQSLAFVRDRHGLADGTDLNRIRMQQMFVSSLFDKLAAAGTLSDPITLYRIADAVTGNLTVDTGLDSIDAMVGLAGSVQSLRSHYIQFITVPYGYDPTNQNRVVPGTGFDQVWADLRQDTPLPGSNAARAFGTAPPAYAAAPTPPGPALPLTGTEVAVYNSTQIPHLAKYASDHLAALGVAATVRQGSPFGPVPRTRVLYPAGLGAQAANLAARFGGSGAVQTVPSTSVHELTLVIGADPPAALVAAPGGGDDGVTGTGDTGGADGTSPDAASNADGASPKPTISAESRAGDQNICSDLPDTVSFGGRP